MVYLHRATGRESTGQNAALSKHIPMLHTYHRRAKHFSHHQRPGAFLGSVRALGALRHGNFARIKVCANVVIKVILQKSAGSCLRNSLHCVVERMEKRFTLFTFFPVPSMALGVVKRTDTVVPMVASEHIVQVFGRNSFDNYLPYHRQLYHSKGSS